ncbi:hypothetical protein JCM19237_292 [Photobacterium aphoticum]|uniref:Uncharacterized protein n=1 Tax=Photobacterium aphoticum TaxID=754436 RepID=A0A090RK96_9GAMM|nr:hypothetical protein JCM19237_292 [Photobacterium aphoticum]
MTDAMVNPADIQELERQLDGLKRAHRAMLKFTAADIQAAYMQSHQGRRSHKETAAMLGCRTTDIKNMIAAQLFIYDGHL